jgi:hypothetical protein
MAFIEWRLFHDKRRNLTVYEKFLVIFSGTESWLHLLNGSSFTIREETSRSRKLSVDSISTKSWWYLLKEALRIEDKEHRVVRKVSSRFNVHFFSR